MGEGPGDDEETVAEPPFASLLGIVEEGPPEQQFEGLTLEEQKGEKGPVKGLTSRPLPWKEYRRQQNSGKEWGIL